MRSSPLCCRLSRHAVDLADPSARGAFLDEALAGSIPVVGSTKTGWPVCF